MTSLARRARDLVRRVSRRTGPRAAVDFVYRSPGSLVVIGWHEAESIRVSHGSLARPGEGRVYRFHRPDLGPVLGPNNLAGFIGVTTIASDPGGRRRTIRTTLHSAGGKHHVLRVPSPAPHELVVDVAERAIASGSIDRRTVVQSLVLPSLRLRIAAQNAHTDVATWAYRSPTYPSTCTLNVVVPFYGTFECAGNIMSVLSLLDTERTAGLAVTFVCDDPRMSASLTEFVSRRNSAVHRLPLGLLTHSTNRGFAAACNSGASALSSDVVLFMNSDVIGSEPTTITRLSDAITGDPTIAAASPTLVFPDGVLQARELERFEDPEFPGFTLLRPPHKGLLPVHQFPPVADVDMLPGAMLAVRTSAFAAVGGFSRAFGSGDFEDADLSIRLHTQGRLVVLDTPAIHLEGHSYRRNVLDVLARSIILEETAPA